MRQGSSGLVEPANPVLCRLDAIADGGATEIAVNVDGMDQSLVVLRRGQEAYAYVNACARAGRRLNWAPGCFHVEDGVLRCATHGERFRVETGECVGGPCRGVGLRRVPVSVTADGNVAFSEARARSIVRAF